MSSVNDQIGLLPGYTDAVFDSQAVFRAMMEATAYPGRVVRLDRAGPAPVPLEVATVGFCLSLADSETPLWLDEKTASSHAAVSWLRFHCGAPIVEESQAARFALVADAESLPRIGAFYAGDIDCPERSTTLIVQVPSLTEGPETVWTGPGIKKSIHVGIAGLPDWFWADWNLNGDVYPRGVDVFFTSGDTVIGLPRTTRGEA